jgi:hypothetical protein
MKYTVTIKDNESGKILEELECNAIVGGASLNEEESVSIGITNCNGAELLGTCKSAKMAILAVLEKDPALDIMFTLFEMKLLAERKKKLKKEMQEKEDTDND